MTENVTTCASCRFSYTVVDAEEQDVYFECRRYPPGPTMFTSDTNSSGDIELEVAVAVWPQIDADGWCGEWSENDGT